MFSKIAIFTEKHSHEPSTLQRAQGAKMPFSTFDHQGEVAVCKRILGHEYPPLVVGAVHALVPGRVHVTQPLHLVISVVGAVDVPVHHALPVVQPVLGPHHAVALAGQDGLRAQRGADVQHRHHNALRV